ncbi:MAG: MFS transporter [Deltaproteobacteria bacterium]|nr:MFS transporter [Deltaproteobacteria bacterium]
MADGERRATWIATVTALVVVASFIAGKAARDALLLSSFGIESLPIFIAISAVFSLPIILIAGRLMARFGPARLMPVLNLLSGAAAIVEWVMLSEYPRATTIAIYFHLSTSGAVLVSGFWSIINERFDVQAAKRHIGRIGVGATLGGIAGGLIAQGTAVYLSTDKIMLVLAGLQIGCALALFVLGGARGPRPVVADDETGTWFAVGVVARSRLLRNVGIMIVLGAIAAGVLDYVFKADLAAGASKADLLSSLAAYYMVTSVLTAVIQLAICGPVIAWLGVPRSVATLPLALTAFSAFALMVPSALAAAVARGAEMVTRSSLYRAGYELLYAPLPEGDKRPTKVILDVGAERIGDLLGAQVVGILVYMLVEPRTALLIATVVIGILALAFALRLPHSYRIALEDSLMASSGDPNASSTATAASESWHALGGLPFLGHSGEPSPLPLRVLERSPRPKAVAPTLEQRQRVTAMLDELRSRNTPRIKRALTQKLTPELAIHVIPLVALDDVGRQALTALRTIAPRCTGMLVDALLDETREIKIRRRLPDVLLAGEPTLAAWGLWRGLVDPSFELRYRCGEALSRMVVAGRLAQVTPETVFEVVRRELVVDQTAWNSQQISEDRVLTAAREGKDEESGRPLEHVFTVLSLAFPPEPLRVALQELQTDDSKLRATALEYLASVLPADIRGQLWPLLDVEVEGSAPAALVGSAVVKVDDQEDHARNDEQQKP